MKDDMSLQDPEDRDATPLPFAAKPSRRDIGRLVGGAALVLLGTLFLLQSLGVVGSIGAFFAALMFGVGGAVFLFVFASDATRWWAVIPGMALLGIGVLLGLEAFSPALGGILGGSVVLGAIGLAFWLVFLTNRDQWWAIIPGGAMLTLALVAALENLPLGIEPGGFFMLGLGLTFLLLAIIPTPAGRIRWAYLPAAVLLLIAVFLIFEAAHLASLVFPLAIIAVGGWLLLRGVRSHPAE